MSAITVPFLGYAISAGGLKRDVDAALAFVTEGHKGRLVSTINPHCVVEATKDAVYREAMQSADILIPDGIGIVWAMRILRRRVKERVSGYDFFWTFSQLAEQKGGVSYFFLGSSQSVLNAIGNQLANDFPNIRVAGTWSPPFKANFSEEENAAMCKVINNSGATVLWVGMTAPKQEMDSREPSPPGYGFCRRYWCGFRLLCRHKAAGAKLGTTPRL